MSTQRATTLQFLPYPFEANGLPMVVEEVRIDGRDVRARIHAEQHVVDLSSDASWHMVEITSSISLDPRLPERLVPESERAAPQVELQIRLRCRKARLRRAVPVPVRDWRAGTTRETITLSRAELRHELELRPVLIRTRPGVRGESAHAWQPEARLAEGRPWLVRVDKEPVQNRAHLDIRFRDFSNLPQAQPDGLYHLEIGGAEPILWLNARDEEVVSALQAKGTTGSMARLRDLLFAQIQVAVWQQLFSSAAAGLHDGETEFTWQQVVLDQWLPELLPNLADAESRLVELEARASAAERAELMQRLDAILQRRTRYGAAVQKILGEISG